MNYAPSPKIVTIKSPDIDRVRARRTRADCTNVVEVRRVAQIGALAG